MLYEYRCTDCTGQRPEGSPADKILVIDFARELPMAKAPPIGSTCKCPNCNRKTAVRIIPSGVTFIVRGSTEVPFDSSHSMMTRVNGQDLKMTFVDHPHTDPAYQRNLAGLAARAGVADGTQLTGLSKAYYSEKHGQVVVDVASNEKDPLGKYERARKQGDMTFTKRHIGTPYKIRGKKK